MNANIVLLVACGVCVTLHVPSIRAEDCQDGSTMPVPGICSDFYICLSGHLVKLSCGAMYFNAKTHSCDAPEAVECDRENGNPPATPSANVCEKRANGDLVASVENCSDFYVCIGKVALARTCAWRHFDVETGKCVDPRFSRCDRSKLMPKSRPVVRYFDEKSGPILITT